MGERRRHLGPDAHCEASNADRVHPLMEVSPPTRPSLAARRSSAPSGLPGVGLAGLIQRLEDSLDPQGVPATVATVVAEALPALLAAVYLKRLDAEDLVLAAAHRTGGDESEGWTAPPGALEPSVRPSRSLVFPLLHQSEVVGQLVVVPLEASPPSSRDLELLATIARRAGPAAQVVRQAHDLKRARERLVLAREEERRRLRRNLHDTIGPTLAAISLKTSALRNLIERDPNAAQEQLLELRDQIHSVITDIRRVAYDLRPPALDELGIVPAIRERARQFSTGGLQIVVDAPDQMPALPAAVEVAAYRIVMEAVMNVSRHAHARLCSVHLSVNDQVRIEVADDGVGLPADHRAGVGMASMRERAAELGGSWTIESVAGGGTRVLAFLPAASRTDAPAIDPGADLPVDDAD